MTKFLTLLGREVRSFFQSPIGYVVMVFFLFSSGFTFSTAVEALNRGPTEFTIIEAFFLIVPFWFVFLLVFPLITMRTFAEEFKMGTIETLMTAPVRDWQVVLSKYLGVLIFYIILWVPSLAYFALFQYFTHTKAVHAAGSYWASYLLMLLIGMFYISIGCLASVVTKNQIIAAVISFCAIFFLFFSGLLGGQFLTVSSYLRDLFAYFSTYEHMLGFSRGVIDSRPIAFYLTMTTLMLALTLQIFQARKWKV